MQLLTIPEVCAVTRLSQAMVSKLIRTGEIPTIHFGHAVRIPAEALDEYLAGKVTTANVSRFVGREEVS